MTKLVIKFFNLNELILAIHIFLSLIYKSENMNIFSSRFKFCFDSTGYCRSSYFCHFSLIFISYLVTFALVWHLANLYLSTSMFLTSVFSYIKNLRSDWFWISIIQFAQFARHSVYVFCKATFSLFTVMRETSEAQLPKRLFSSSSSKWKKMFKFPKFDLIFLIHRK